MARAVPIITQFNAGEISPRLYGRVDLDWYDAGCREAQNMLGQISGAAERRPGSIFQFALTDSDLAGRMLRFEFNAQQKYAMVVNAGIMKFLKPDGVVVAENVTATITNGDFDTDVTGWTDQSTGAAAISHELVGSEEEGNAAALAGVTYQFGDNATQSRSIGLKFTNTSAGNVRNVMFDVSSVSTAFDAVAGIYEDNAGSPGSQVGSNSDALTLNATGAKTLTWSGTGPALSAATDYWVVLTDSTGGGTGEVRTELSSDQGAEFASGRSDTITSIADGTNSFDTAYEWRIRVTVVPSDADGVLVLEGVAGETAIAEQQVAISEAGTRHLLAFRVHPNEGRASAYDEVVLRIGTSSGGTDVIDDYAAGVGWHVVGFSTTAASVYVQFRNAAAKSLYVDDVAILDNQDVSIPVPWASGDLETLQIVQSGDTVWVTHDAYPQYRLQRYADDAWSLEQVGFVDGPYLPENTSDITLDPSATTGLGISVVASQPIFSPEHVCRLLRFKDGGSSWGWGVFTEYVSPTEMKLDVREDFNAHGANTTWRLGLWGAQEASPTDLGNADQIHAGGYPPAAVLHEGRLWFGGALNYPLRLDGSRSDDFENMAPGVEDDDPISRTLATGLIDAIRWLVSARTLIAGTAAGTVRIGSDDLNSPLTPSNTEIKPVTRYGSSVAPAIVVTNNVIVYVQRSGRQVREMVFDVAIDNYEADNLLKRAEHLTRGYTIDRIVWQSSPFDVFWAVRSDGMLLAGVFDRAEGVMGWYRCPLAASDAGVAVVEDVLVLPGDSADGGGAQDKVYVLVRRTIDGATKRYVELLADLADDDAAFADAFHVDSGLTYSGVSTTTISGLDHLEGETGVVAFKADGTYESGLTVTGGSVTLSAATTKAQIGLDAPARLKPMPLEAGARDGTAQGRNKSVPFVNLRVFRSGSFKAGPNDANLRLRDYTDFTDPDMPVDIEIPMGGGWEKNGDWLVESVGPYPLTVVAAMPAVSTGEGR